MIHWNLTDSSGGVWRRVNGNGFRRTQVCARIHACTYCGWRSGRKRAGSTIPLSERVRSSCTYTPLINARTTTEIPRLGFSSAGAKIYHRALLSTLRYNPVPRIASCPPPRAATDQFASRGNDYDPDDETNGAFFVPRQWCLGYVNNNKGSVAESELECYRERYM